MKAHLARRLRHTRMGRHRRPVSDTGSSSSVGKIQIHGGCRNRFRLSLSRRRQVVRAIWQCSTPRVLPISLWQVGLASAPSLDGPWSRCTGLNPVPWSRALLRIRSWRSLPTHVRRGLRQSSAERSRVFNFRGRHSLVRGQHLVVQQAPGFGPAKSGRRWDWSRKVTAYSRFSILRTKWQPGTARRIRSHADAGAVGFVELRVITAGELAAKDIHSFTGSRKRREKSGAGTTANTD